MKLFKYSLLPLLTLLIAVLGCGSSSDEPESAPAVKISVTPSSIDAPCQKSETTVTVDCSQEWSIYTNDSWIKCVKARDNKTATITISENLEESGRVGKATVKSGITTADIEIHQAGKPAEQTDPDINVPDGYKLVWHDEFDEGTEPSSEWNYETGAGGWGNNEIQDYVKCYAPNGDQLATVKDGILTITCAKIGDKVHSIRMNTNKGWTYGYFEARLKLPKGKGTWPAYWMMPKNFKAWPDDGEIDIMEEVGYHPNYVSSSIHCKAYNHSIGTQKTNEKLISGAQDDFHIYALEWTEDYIRTYVDGKQLFYFENDKKNNKDTWPFNTAFYIKLNLAWGGNWGGAQGIDESCLPAKYEIDYVRVFQKK